MRRPFANWFAILGVTIVVTMLASIVHARPSIRRDFFDTYTNAVGTQLDALPSDSRHCGVCHFDFSGGGPRNPYGFDVQVGIGSGLTNIQAFLAIEGNDSDGDGFSNIVEITDTVNFTNTPTFPGLETGNVGSTSNIPLTEITPYLTPMGATDTTPPTVTVLYPNGGESVSPNTTELVSFTATDDQSGVSHVDVYLSDDGGTTFKPVGVSEDPTVDFAWFVPNLPSGTNVIRIEAYDNAGNEASDDSDADFTILTFSGGRVPTTLRDMELPGTQPFEGAVLQDPTDCRQCHGDYNTAIEPWHNWSGSMMGQAMRDPLFLACMAVAEQDAPGVGDLCIRCHSPGGWQEGRSVDTGGGLLTPKDRHAIQCDFCHRIVDRNYVSGVSPPQDVDVLDNVSPLPSAYANGQFINDSAPLRRGPYADAAAAHSFVDSPIHRSANACGTCHDVSSPVFEQIGPGNYAPTAWDQEHPDFDLRNMFPIERTFSEWGQSEYATTGVFAPQFAGNKADGIVSTCQDCHMRDVFGKGCNEGGTPNRDDLPLHDFTGGNTFIPDILPSFFPNEVDVAALQDAKARATSMLELAATLEAESQGWGLKVTVWNETGHKLPSGYPEGRRIWLNVVAYDAQMTQVFESGAYDFATAVLAYDPQVKVYEIKPGLSPGLAGFLGLPEGPSFHFVLNDTVYSDNRIPPRGFTNAGFAAIQSPPVHYTYADGQYWDDTQYFMPAEADTAVVTLYYQTLSKEYVEFLRDENNTNSMGQDLYDAWAANGMSAPVVMAQVGTKVNVGVSDVTETNLRIPASLSEAWPNPFTASTQFSYYVPRQGPVSVEVYDVRGRRVRTLVTGAQETGRYEIAWNGRDDVGRELSAGVYFVRYRTDQRVITRRMLRLQ